MMPTDKLAAVLWEADRHVDTLTEALAEWNVSPTTTWQALESDRARFRIVDQLLFRFIKLLDTVGERLIPATLATRQPPHQGIPLGRHAGPQADPAQHRRPAHVMQWITMSNTKYWEKS